MKSLIHSIRTAKEYFSRLLNHALPWMKSSWLVINVRSCGTRIHYIGFFLVLPKEREGQTWVLFDYEPPRGAPISHINSKMKSIQKRLYTWMSGRSLCWPTKRPLKRGTSPHISLFERALTELVLTQKMLSIECMPSQEKVGRRKSDLGRNPGREE